MTLSDECKHEIKQAKKYPEKQLERKYQSLKHWQDGWIQK